MDTKTLLTIIEHFNGSTIAELELESDALKLVLRKDSAVMNRNTVSSTALPGPSSVQTPEKSVSRPETAAESTVRLGLPAQSENVASNGEYISSPIVATFYRSPSPDAPSFVEEGSTIRAGQTLCILEAMKMMNHLEAEFDCEIIKIKAQNGELVEYGQALFEVKRL